MADPGPRNAFAQEPYAEGCLVFLCVSSLGSVACEAGAKAVAFRWAALHTTLMRSEQCCLLAVMPRCACDVDSQIKASFICQLRSETCKPNVPMIQLCLW